ncbi:hypothetical protein BZG36_00343 [Bifiguratus adelaidae]|uniref:hydroxyacylglutathione hydrolase n=1 Tax=Bifiguratus adelaidae TaxID=1938954 RepID=A0A261Y801_9FUNG|nr:hypothetical protein BZG36_00343 [Bifiguratus adelaidae]
MKVIPIPVLEDNFSYILIDEKTKEAAIIDPAEPIKILNILSQTGAKLTTILTTHHHWDHSGGNIDLIAKKPGLAVYGADARIPEINYVCKDKEDICLGTLTITPLHTPCHTKGHICYYVQDGNSSKTNGMTINASSHPTQSPSKAVFTGDTLFIAGCGRFFEGDARDMYRCLYHVLGELPGETVVYGGHDYVRSNVDFALSINPQNSDLHMFNANVGSIYQQHDQHYLGSNPSGRPFIVSTIEQEKKINPFLRCHDPAIMAAVGKTDPVEVLGGLREMKDEQR